MKKEHCDDHAVTCASILNIEKQIARSEKKRWSLFLVFAGSFVAIVIAIVSGGIWIGELETKAANAAENQRNDRSDIKALREDLLRLERQNSAQNQKLFNSVIKVEERIIHLDRRIESIERRSNR